MRETLHLAEAFKVLCEVVDKVVAHFMSTAVKCVFGRAFNMRDACFVM